MRSPLILLCALFSLVACTSVQLPEGAIELPKKIDETSGLASFGDHFLTLNDSGGKATLYSFNKKGERLGKHKIEGAINRDWEDIAQDSTHFYIADTGNNYATRKDLTIYIVNQAFKLEDSIKVSYASQTKFEKKENKYDAETLIAYGDSLLIFSKTANRVRHNSMLSLKKQEATPLRNCLALRSMPSSQEEIMMLRQSALDPHGLFTRLHPIYF